MPAHHETCRLPYSPAQMFALVADIEKYPEFLPWCTAARILSRGEGYVIAELAIHFKGFTESYVSRVEFHPPPGEAHEGRIDVTLERGPFSHLTNKWRFIPEDSGTRIEFVLDFAFKSRVLEMLAGRTFLKAAEKMVAAFTSRADALYRSAEVA